MSGDYSAARARASLVHFGLGKGASALVGLAVLLLTLRLAPTDAFGGYVVLMAVTEIFYVVSGLGLSFVVQRYVPELRVRASSLQFGHKLRHLFYWRVGLAVGFALPVCMLAGYWAGWIDLRMSVGLSLWFGGNLVFGSIMRYFDELLQTLLLQGWAQVLILARNILRLLVLCVAWAGFLVVDLALLLALEAVVAIVATLAAYGVIAAYLQRPRSESNPAHMLHVMPDAVRQSLRFYVAQILAQAYGGNSIKLVVNAVTGVEGAGIFGFAYSITNILRTYSPAFLLSGWVRPLLVARFLDRGHASALKPLTRLIVSVSVVGLLPFLIVFFVFGQQIAATLGNGRYPAAAGLLAPLMIVVCLQALHAVLGMVCATVERAGFVLLATGVCLVTLPAAYALTQVFGLPGAVVALFIGEALWITSVLVQLGKHLGEVGFADLAGLSRALLLGGGVGLALWLACHGRPMMMFVEWLGAAFVMTLIYWVLAWYCNVIGADERALMRNFLRRA